MKLRTRLLVTFLTIIILPIALTALSAFSVGYYIQRNAKEAYGLEKIDLSLMIDPVHSFTQLTNEDFENLKQTVDHDVDRLNDVAFLDEINEHLSTQSSFLIVRKGTSLFYTGNGAVTEEFFDSLGAYGMENREAESGYYYNNMEKVVRQIDFTFSDGTQGSIFIITKITTFLSPKILRNILIMIITILLITSFTLTSWIKKGVFSPIRDLNLAMKNIADGNLEYTLPPQKPKKKKGEIDNLYENYEQMRLRLKESSDEKLQGDKQNRELISNISHDLKTPITSIKGYVEGIIDGVADTPEKVNKYVRTIYNKANDMDRLINELTIYSNIDANRIPYHFHKINISDYFSDCIEEVGLDLESKAIKLNYANLVSPDTLIIADPEQLKRVINNIVSNSVKYLDKKEGVIDIRILDEVDSIRVEIEDNGKGVSQKELGRIFERFYRTDASRNSAQGGSGIGLSIVKKIVEDHGGYIWATSKEGEGTCMHFVIRKYVEMQKDQHPEV